jgi:hypothetical protein
VPQVAPAALGGDTAATDKYIGGVLVNGDVIYIGKAKNFRLEVRQTLGRKIPVSVRFGPDLTKSRPKIRTIATFLSLYEVPSSRARHNIEALLIRVIPNQTHNSNIGWFD